MTGHECSRYTVPRDGEEIHITFRIELVYDYDEFENCGGYIP